MSVAATRTSRPSSGLAELLDRGVVIDAFVCVSLIGLEVLTINARIVIASVDTYLRYAEAMNRLDLAPETHPRRLHGAMRELTDASTESRTRAALSHVNEVGSLRDKVTGKHSEQQ